MNSNHRLWRSMLRLLAILAAGAFAGCGLAFAADPTPPSPLVAWGQPVNWWFVFKFNAKDFPGCGAPTDTRTCTFDAHRSPKAYTGGFGQQYVFASSANSSLAKGDGCAGQTSGDPLGATFGQIFTGSYFYVIWNDQPKGHPSIHGCAAGGDCASPWGHSKGLLAWNDDGEGVIVQVTTPSWPLAASQGAARRGDANTLGCVVDDNVKLSQHFFAVKLTKDDLVQVLQGLQNASIATDPGQLQLVNNGGPADVQALVAQLGTKSTSTVVFRATLSSGAELIAKPSRLHVPPWQMVSALLGGEPLRAATFWNAPKIPTTDASTPVACWDDSLGTPGPVEIALTGQWSGTTLEVGSGGNHAKIGVSTSPDSPVIVFGDENQQGSLDQACGSSQNGRGGLFFVMKDLSLATDVRALLNGQTAPTAPTTVGTGPARQ